MTPGAMIVGGAHTVMGASIHVTATVTQMNRQTNVTKHETKNRRKYEIHV